MSLFQTKTWWGTSVEGEDELDQDCMICGDISNSGGFEIVLGTFSGKLMVLKPGSGGYQPEHLLIEKNLGAPVLAVSSGRFSSPELNSLAVLHPSKLVLYSLSSAGGAYELTEVHSHILDHTAATLVTGQFGGSISQDSVCVQTMDGQLVFFQGKRRVFHRYLKDFLVPGPLCYIPPLDSFVTASSAFVVELYKYKGLEDATSGEKKESRDPDPQEEAEGGQKGTKGKDVVPSWRWVMGEGAVAIKWAPALSAAPDKEDTSKVDILVLGERHLFILNPTGTCKSQVIAIFGCKVARQWIIKMDYSPMAMSIVPTPAPITGVNYHLMLSTHTGSLMLYRGTRLVWGAKSDIVPICMATASVAGTDGMIVAADDKGKLEIMYLGTDPPLNVVQVVESKEVDFEAMDAEHQQLLAKIREHTSGENKPAATDRLIMRTNVPLVCDQEDTGVRLSNPLGGDAGPSKSGAEGRSVTATVTLGYEGKGAARDVVLRVACPASVECAHPCVEFSEVRSGGTPATASLTFTHTGDMVPPNNVVTVMATYTTGQGQSQAAVATLKLPAGLFVDLVPPIKEAAYKIVLDTNRPPPQLTLLFDDLVAQSTSLASTAAANVLSVRFVSGQEATIIVSRTGGRYRVQSDHFHPMWLFADELCTRLRALFAGQGGADKGEEPFKIQFLEPLPLGDLFEVMDSHLEARLSLTALMEELEKRATQFRSIQKRLLVRFKDRNPEPLKHLDELLNSTHRQLVELGNRARELWAQVRLRRCEMAGALRLILTLAKLQYGIEGETAEVLDAFVSPDALDARETAWEQVTQASVAWALAREEGGFATAPSLTDAIEDTAELKKLIAAFMDRVKEAPDKIREL